MRLSSERAMTLARAAARELGLDGEGGVLLRERASVLIVLPGADVVARVESAGRRSLAGRQVALARAFERCGSPTVRLVRAELQPVMFEAGAVTLWQRLQPEPAACCDERRIGALTRAVHETTRGLVRDAAPGELPALDPFEELDGLLEALDAGDYDHARARALGELRDELKRRWVDCPNRLQDSGRSQGTLAALGPQVLGDCDPVGRVLVHGDVHRENVIVTAAGPVFVDLELGGVGPAAWDFVPLVAGVRRYGTDPSALEQRILGYGADLRGSAGFELQCEIYELACALWAVHCRRQSPLMAAEAGLRVSAILDGGPLDRGPRWSLL